MAEKLERVLEKFIFSRKKREILGPSKKDEQPNVVTVNPYEGRGRMDDPEQDPRIQIRGANNDPIIKIQTISDSEFKKTTGSLPDGSPKRIVVTSPILTTQPIVSVDRDDIQNNNPRIRVITEKGPEPPGVTPFINPYTSTQSRSLSSLLEPDKNNFDPKGYSTTKNYDEMKSRMGNYKINIDGVSMDILLPTDVTDEFSGTKVSIGGVPGNLSVKSKSSSNEFTSNKTGNEENDPMKIIKKCMDFDGTDQDFSEIDKEVRRYGRNKK